MTKNEKLSNLIIYKGIQIIWPLEKNRSEILVILGQQSLKTDNSASSYDTFWFLEGFSPDSYFWKKVIKNSCKNKKC